MKNAVFQAWWESDRAWGMRPDGFSLHPNTAALRHYLERERYGLEARDFYSRPSCHPVIIELPDDMFDYLFMKPNGSLVTGFRHYASTEPEKVAKLFSGRMRKIVKDSIKEIERERELQAR